MSASETGTKTKKNPQRIRNLGLLGTLLAAFSLVNAYDALADFSGIVKYVVDKWRFLVTEFWNIVLSFIDIPKITRFDAVFLTFFSMMILSLLTSLNINDPNISRIRFRQGILFTIFGMLILAAIFTVGDMTTYNVVVAEKGPSFYQNSLQAFFYEIYTNIIQPETWGVPSQYGLYVNIATLYVFYIIIISLTFAIILTFSYVVGLYVNIWSMASRTWMIIMFFSVIVVFNYIIIYIEIFMNR